MLKEREISILVLDDDPFMLKLLVCMLSDLGVSRVNTHTCGREALAWLDSEDKPVDLILLDIQMPEMDGVEFLRHLVERRYAGRLILVSGEDERVLQTVESLVQAHGLANLGYLSKPVQPEALSELLAAWKPAGESGPRRTEQTYSPEAVREAIHAGELVVYYQPKVELASGKASGVESLVRWRHPRDGLVYPEQFIGVAEAHGLIDDLTRGVIAQAFAQARAWRDAGLDLVLAVNLSMDNLAVVGFADEVTAAAAAAGLKPEHIVLEVTESQLMKNTVASMDVLARLRMKRFGLSIDDFGTGNSSLVQLRDIPFTELKLDRGFVHGAASNDTLRAIYGASLGLAKQLGIKAVAEGVEDRTDWDFLRGTGCDLAQGYFIAKPMSADEIPDWIADWQGRFEAFLSSSRTDIGN